MQAILRTVVFFHILKGDFQTKLKRNDSHDNFISVGLSLSLDSG